MLLLTIPVLYARSIIEAFALTRPVASTLSSSCDHDPDLLHQLPPEVPASATPPPSTSAGRRTMCFVVMALFAFVVWALSTAGETAAGLVAVPVWLAVLWVSWFSSAPHGVPPAGLRVVRAGGRSRRRRRPATRNPAVTCRGAPQGNDRGAYRWRHDTTAPNP
ncbi:hypothetical protein QJS66_18135 [Kocuria rhizophila]|nr:hypothetical protein QJS66_18135 [Kocuria rhizophila]